MRQNVSEAGEVMRLELLHRASTYGDIEAWGAFQQGLEEMVLTWFHHHPVSEAASRLQRKSHIVKQAFEQFWRIVIQEQVRCETLEEILVCLRACLNGAILEELRIARRPGAPSSLTDREEPCESGVVWDQLQAALSTERERRLAYLLYQCGLSPADIVRCCPQEWSDVGEVARLRRRILTQLLQSPVLVSPEEIGEIQEAACSRPTRDGTT